MFKMESVLNKDHAVISVKGDLTVESYSELEEEVEMLVSRGVDNLILDFSGLDFIDSRGAGSLVKLNAAYHGSMFITGLMPQMRETLNRLMVYEKFNVSKSVEEAVSRLG